ncbi:DNA-directed RNA polymerase III subunit RPC6 [Parasteatoda tepidariorum]|uniref:DNA-directed RNA polymerase III subunit RPC6 n=1 Tax=Parasteatoda tepidariorum TaxID=114398 RepID=UPI001C718B3D|nr:DNA-directed RNA polymerase III subunit RPC6 [Parasteatoda tepidariorum]
MLFWPACRRFCSDDFACSPFSAIMTEKKSASSELEEKVIEVLASDANKNGISQADLQKAIPTIQAKELAPILNSLMSQGKLDVTKKRNQLCWRWNADAKVIKGSQEEKIIFKIIKGASDKGLAVNQIKRECGLPQPRVTKILKELESRKEIKLVIAKNKRKLYMLYDLTPSVEVTGGTFYSGDEFEAEFVNVLGDQCYRYLLQAKGISEKLLDPLSQRHASFKSSKEICDYINGLKISTVELKVFDIENILESLIYDGKIVKNTSLGLGKTSENCYAVSKSVLSNVGLMRMPCGVCLVFKECGVGLSVSPSTCQYMKEWLDF